MMIREIYNLNFNKTPNILKMFYFEELIKWFRLFAMTFNNLENIEEKPVSFPTIVFSLSLEEFCIGAAIERVFPFNWELQYCIAIKRFFEDVPILIAEISEF